MAQSRGSQCPPVVTGPMQGLYVIAYIVTDFVTAIYMQPQGLDWAKGTIAPEILHIGEGGGGGGGGGGVQIVPRKHPFHDIQRVRIDSAIENGERPKLDDIP